MRPAYLRIFVVAAVFLQLLLPDPSLCIDANTGARLVSEGDRLAREFKLAEAENKFEEALRTSETSGDKGGMAVALEKLGGLASEFGNYTDAAGSYGHALKLYSELRLKDSEVRVHVATGTAFEDWGDLAGAIFHYREALKLEPAPADRARIESKLGAVYLLLGDEEACVSHLKASQNAARAASDMKQLGAILLQLGEAYQKTGSPDLAKASYLEALGLKGQMDVASRAQICLGDVSLAAKDMVEAESSYTKAKYSIGLGRVSLMANKWEEALKHFQQALIEAEHLQEVERVFAARTGIGISFMAQGQNPKAEEHLRLAVEALEEVRDMLPVGKRMYFLSGSTHGFSRLASYEALVNCLVLQGKNEEAFKIAEFTRSRVLTEAVVSKTALVKEKTDSPAQPPVPETTVSAGPAVQEPSRVAIELVPFSFLDSQFRSASLNAHDAAVFSLLVKAVLLDFEKAESEKAESMGASFCQKAGFNSKASETVKSKRAVLRQKGVKNHLTAPVDNEPGTK